MSYRRPRVAPVSIVVITFRRNKALGECLSGLERQSVMPREVIVVDNSPEEAARMMISRRMRESPYRLRYLSEKRKGTVFARAKGLREARGAYVAHIDDDCIPERAWIEYGYHALKASRAAAVTGRNLNGYPSNVYAAVEHYDCELYLQRYMHKLKGSTFTYTLDTKNLFVDKRQVLGNGIRHDSRFARVNILEDMDYAMQLNVKGMAIAYEHRAAVTHKGRCEFKSHVSREFRRGRAQAIFEAKWKKKLQGRKHMEGVLRSFDAYTRSGRKEESLKTRLTSSLLKGAPEWVKIRFRPTTLLSNLVRNVGYYYEKSLSILRNPEKVLILKP